MNINIWVPDAHYHQQLKLFIPNNIEANHNGFEVKLANLVKMWQQGANSFSFTTSGSTGLPQTISFTRSQIELSAKATLRFFNITKNNVLVATLDLSKVGGAMQVFRAWVGRLPLVVLPPQSTPLFNHGAWAGNSFVSAMVPYQLDQLLSTEQGVVFLQKHKLLLTGGGPISQASENKIMQLGINAWHTYGMTETLSNVAARPYGTPCYQPIPPHQITLNDAGRVVVQTPLLPNKPLVTNDLAHPCPGNAFAIRGRADGVIISGGHKIIPEEVEAALSKCLQKYTYCIAHKPSLQWGQVVVLVIEGKANNATKQAIKQALKHCTDTLPNYQKPKQVLWLDQLPRVGNNKINRKALLALITQAPS